MRTIHRVSVISWTTCISPEFLRRFVRLIHHRFSVTWAEWLLVAASEATAAALHYTLTALLIRRIFFFNTSDYLCFRSVGHSFWRVFVLKGFRSTWPAFCIGNCLSRSYCNDIFSALNLHHHLRKGGRLGFCLCVFVCQSKSCRRILTKFRCWSGSRCGYGNFL